MEALIEKLSEAQQDLFLDGDINSFDLLSDIIDGLHTSPERISGYAALVLETLIETNRIGE